MVLTKRDYNNIGTIKGANKKTNRVIVKEKNKCR